MRLSPEAREIVMEAAREAFTRRLTAEEMWVEVVRLCREASTPEEIEAAGTLVGRVTGLGKIIRGAAAAPPEPPDTAVAVAISEPDPDPVDVVAEKVA